MKVLAISSSPRTEGNSDVLCDQFLKGAKEGEHETEKINISNKDIAPCSACGLCQRDHKCIHNDDMEAILEAMIAADVIVLATPVYFYSMCAQMKLLIDRSYSRFMEITNKKFYFIVTSADPEHKATEETIAGLRGFLRCLPGAQECGIIYGCGTWDKGDVYRHPALERAYETGKLIKQ